ncbi:hypothetical protein WH52_10475 [Tenacibaculum holothuriorum]|uniref:Ig-like domain-containing protein n=1 Tax=Tenacibaculum holothuriorum TaxID=1635173 RepID=A0A1Y2PDN0_9FLAO|nr:gliding motility-associated C-terminal domain-containing protein [Tenacibaculum holothuriorum]OSY87839.1 hypothetical protein WH52_10475 [Tenacibaculum holothuriorum]
MIKISAKSVFLLGILMLTLSLNSFSQVLTKPTLKFTNACNNASTPNFGVDILYHTAAFNTDNVFHLELSDADGNFADPATSLLTIVNENNTFSFSRNFELPVGTFGRGYKIRVRATSPAMISPESDVFEAYQGMLSSSEVKINNGDREAVICGNTSTTLTLNITTDGVYNWTRDGNSFTTTSSPQVEVTQPGLYNVQIDYGACGGVFAEAGIIVKRVSNTEATIEGGSVIEICGNETHTFRADGGFVSGLTYKWFKDNTEVFSSTTTHEYTTPNSNQFGMYKLRVEAGSCSSESAEVELKSKTGVDFTPAIKGDDKNVIIPGERLTLELEDLPSTLTNVSIRWYRNNTATGVTGNSSNIADPGVYYAEVTEGSGSCVTTKKSNEVTIVLAKEFLVEIEKDSNSNYEECKLDKVKLVISNLKALGTDDEEYTLAADRVTQLNTDNVLRYRWFKDTTEVNNAINNNYEVPSYLENGVYYLEVRADLGVKGDSDNQDVKLTIFPEVTSNQTSNSLCPNGTITYTITDIVAGFTYEWRDKDNNPITLADPKVLEVTEVGTYTLHFSGFGCQNNMEPIEVIPFDDSAVQVSPSEKIVVPAGQTVTATASGANSYEWYDDSGALLSTNSTLEVNNLGFYTLVAKVDNCEVRKTIEAVEEDGKIVVPNIVTPNQDGINDTWLIPNRYAFQPTVTISIYNSSGREVFNTNDYQNNWPQEDLGNQKVFYYRIQRDEKVVKAGTISILD